MYAHIHRDVTPTGFKIIIGTYFYTDVAPLGLTADCRLLTADCYPIPVFSVKNM